MAHHTRLVQRRLSVEDDDIPIGEMTVDLAVNLRGLGGGDADVGAVERGGYARRLGREELVGVCGALFFGEAVLLSCDREIQFVFSRCSLLAEPLPFPAPIESPTHQTEQMTILHLDEARSRVDMRSIDDELAHEVDVVGGDGFGEGELASEDGRDSNLVSLDVDVGGDDRTGGVVDSLALLVV